MVHMFVHALLVGALSEEASPDARPLFFNKEL
jgi:hypothetical protein